MKRRWSIAILITVAIAISYLDRLTLSVAIDAMRQDIPISDETFGSLNVAFLLAYGLMYMGGGRLIDALGTRRGFFWIMVFWSLACASHGLAMGFWMLAISRFLLGLGEGGGFPAATKAVAEWFPVRERSSAMGLINAGTAVGSVIAPPLIAAIILQPRAGGGCSFSRAASGWCGRCGGSGNITRQRSSADLAGRARRNPARTTRPTPRPRTPPARGPVCCGMRVVWGLVIAKFLSDGAWFFYSFWLPKYLLDVRDFNTKEVGYYAWIPYAASGVGSLLGGAFSSWLLHRGFSLNIARKIALGVSARAHAVGIPGDHDRRDAGPLCFSASRSLGSKPGRRS